MIDKTDAPILRHQNSRLLAFIADDRAVRKTFVFDEGRVIIIKKEGKNGVQRI